METENYNQIKKTPVTFVLITLCTCKRPLMLKECLLSVNSLEIPDGIRAEVLVVDNDKNKSAEPVIKKREDPGGALSFSLSAAQDPPVS